MIKPIETCYKGYRFRSRLEARWAVCFDELGIDYEYEKEGFKLIEGLYYLPDFWLPYSESEIIYRNIPQYSGHWVEIKGYEPTKEDMSKLLLLSINTKHNGVMLVGSPWEYHFYFTNRHGLTYGPHIPRCFSDGLHADEAHGLHTLFNRFIQNGGTFDAIIAAKQARFEHGECG